MTSLKDALAAGRRAFSFNIRSMRTAEAVAIAKAAGLQWLFIDMEHSALDLKTVQSLCLAGLSAELPPLVRVPDLLWISHVLDCGAAGVIIPHVEDAAQASDVVQRSLFPPLGRRSVSGPLHQLGLAALPAREIMRRSNDETVVVVMIESQLGLDNADATAAVPGVDVLLIGTNDLAAELGIPGELRHPQMEQAYSTVVGACRRHGKQAGIGGIYDPDVMGHYLDLGICFAQGGGDTAFLLEGARTRMALLSNLAGAHGAPVDGGR